MTANDPAASADDLLAHAPWVRRLAERLARGDGDDLSQDVWLKAMTSRPGSGVSPRDWLATIVRNTSISSTMISYSKGGEVSSAGKASNC